MTEQEREVLIKEVELLKVRKKDVKDFIESIDLADKIHNIEMKLNGVRPTDSYVECIGCGA
jgi:hypothetical protein|tara:strand:- start:317 stop:499 length:183 start_codon:yes stop_codon:yes gene_type:complete